VSLAWRILLLALSLNVVTVGSVQIAVYFAQRSWLRDRDASVRDLVQGSFAELGRVYTPGALRSASADAAVVRRLLTATTTRGPSTASSSTRFNSPAWAKETPIHTAAAVKKMCLIVVGSPIAMAGAPSRAPLPFPRRP